MKANFLKIISRITELIEAVVAIIILAVIVVGGILLVQDIVHIITDPALPFSVNDFLSGALALIVGIEFVKMLIKHTPGAVIEVLLFAIARQMIVSHNSALDTLLGAVAVACIFAVRKFLYVHSFDSSRDRPPTDGPISPPVADSLSKGG